MIGRIVSTKQPKTAVVLVERKKMHPLYKKSYASSKHYLVDDPLGVKEGDVVEFVKVRPISKYKHWRITQVVGQDVVALGEQAMEEVVKEAIGKVLPEEKTVGSEASVLPSTEEKTTKAKATARQKRGGG